MLPTSYYYVSHSIVKFFFKPNSGTHSHINSDTRAAISATVPSAIVINKQFARGAQRAKSLGLPQYVCWFDYVLLYINFAFLCFYFF